MSKNIINANLRWLTVCLLLVLTILLLWANLFPSNSSASNSITAISTPTRLHTPTPKPTSKPTPKPTPTSQTLSSELGLSLLESPPQELSLDRFDSNKLLHDDSTTNTKIIGKIQNYTNDHFMDRQAALVIIYVDSQIQQAPDVAKKLEDLFTTQLANISVYSQTVYQSRMFTSPGSTNDMPQVVLEIYLFAASS